LKICVLRKKGVELFLKRARRGLAGGQLVKNNFEYFCLHGFVPIQSSPEPRLMLHKRVCFNVGSFMVLDQVKALERIRPASGWRGRGLPPAVSRIAFMTSEWS